MNLGGIFLISFKLPLQARYVGNGKFDKYYLSAELIGKKLFVIKKWKVPRELFFIFEYEIWFQINLYTPSFFVNFGNMQGMK